MKRILVCISLISILLGSLHLRLPAQKMTYFYTFGAVRFHGKPIPFERGKSSDAPLLANGFEFSAYCLQYRQPPRSNNSKIRTSRKGEVLFSKAQEPFEKQGKGGKPDLIWIFTEGCDLLLQITRSATLNTMQIYLHIDYDYRPEAGKKGPLSTIPFKSGKYLIDLRAPSPAENGDQKSMPRRINWRQAKMKEDWNPASELWY